MTTSSTEEASPATVSTSRMGAAVEAADPGRPKRRQSAPLDVGQCASRGAGDGVEAGVGASLDLRRQVVDDRHQLIPDESVTEGGLPGRAATLLLGVEVGKQVADRHRDAVHRAAGVAAVRDGWHFVVEQIAPAEEIGMEVRILHCYSF